jgi:hypothetical protein
MARGGKLGGRYARRGWRVWYVPRLENLEQRLPPGDALVGVLAAGSLRAPPGLEAAAAARESSLALPEELSAAAPPRRRRPEPAPASDFAPPGGRVATADGTTRSAVSWEAPLQAASVVRSSTGMVQRADVAGEVPVTSPGGPLTPRAVPPGLAARSAHGQVDSLPAAAPASPLPTSAAARGAYGSLPIYFEANRGQTDRRVDFLARGPGYTVYLTPAEAVFVVQESGGRSQGAGVRGQGSEAGGQRSEVSGQRPGAGLPGTGDDGRSPKYVSMQLVGGDAAAAAVGADALPTRVNYFVGSDPAKWHTDVPTYGRVEYANVYPGISLAYYPSPAGRGAGGEGLEYDFTVSPGADPSAIALSFAGADGVDVSPAGDLLVHAGSQTLVQHAPVAYQDVAGTRQPVASRFALHSGLNTQNSKLLTFDLGPYDRSRPLVIDPVLSYSTFLGGSSGDYAYAVAVDGAGAVYLTGQTYSANFPLVNPAQPAYAGGGDAFVAKLNPAGTALVYATYLGGSGGCGTSGDDSGQGIAVDPQGSAYVTGYTEACNFPVLNALQPAFGGGGADAFAAKFSAGGALAYSTYLGGAANDSGNAVAVDAAGNAFVMGVTSSADFPTYNALQPVYGGGWSDAFVSKIDAGGAAFDYSTYLGGSGPESYSFGIGGIAVDAKDRAYVTGETSSYDFPTYKAFQPVAGGGNSDAFVTKFSADGSHFVYSTFLGGDGGDSGRGIATDAAGNAYVVGVTGSADFPLANPYQAVFEVTDAFVTKLSADGSSLVYSTYLGGSVYDYGYAIAADATGSAYVTGLSYSKDFPTLHPFQPYPGDYGKDNAFVTKITPAGNALAYSSYLGGTDEDYGGGVAVDRFGNAYVVGGTKSSDFPTVNAFQPLKAGSFDAFITKVSRLGRQPAAANRL